MQPNGNRWDTIKEWALEICLVDIFFGFHVNPFQVDYNLTAGIAERNIVLKYHN